MKCDKMTYCDIRSIKDLPETNPIIEKQKGEGKFILFLD